MAVANPSPPSLLPSHFAPLADPVLNTNAAMPALVSRLPVLPPLDFSLDNRSTRQTIATPARSTPNATSPIARFSSTDSTSKAFSLLLPILSNSRTHAALVSFLDWPSTLALLNSCKDFRSLFDLFPEIRDMILSRYVPGYAFAVASRDHQRVYNVPISLQDLTLLVRSLSVPLHCYPMHALSILTALCPTYEHDQQTELFTLLTQAHSRIVLLLQANVHSSSLPLTPEPATAQSYLRHVPQHSSIRELTFPAPLSCSKEKPRLEQPLPAALRPRGRKLATQNSTLFSSQANSHVHTHSSSLSVSHNHQNNKQRKISIFNSKKKLPPPPSLPSTLKWYSSTWRRTLAVSSSTYHTASASSGSGSASEDDCGDEAYTSNSDRLSVSGFYRGDTSTTANTSPARSSSSSDNSFVTPFPSNLSVTENVIVQSTTSPHDLILASVRSRAPILRVFVPCADMNDGGPGVLGCEEALISGGLWDHLSVGDVICNLGYVPSSDGDSTSILSASFGSPSPLSQFEGDSQRKWLIFNGTCLVPFIPTSEHLPLQWPLMLPSPWYYSHIMESTENPRFAIATLPRPGQSATVHYELIRLPTKVRSPHSIGGLALVNQYRWTARVDMRSTPDAGRLGEGWKCEWTLEGEGTEEGKRVLMDCLRGTDLGCLKWEFVREKSGGSKIWLKLLNPLTSEIELSEDLHTFTSVI